MTVIQYVYYLCVLLHVLVTITILLLSFQRLKQFETRHLSQDLSDGLNSMQKSKRVMVRKTIPEKDRPKPMRK